MPIFHDIEQRTPAWDDLRRGKLTASVASKLVTPTGKLSNQYKSEIARIIAEHKGLQDPEFIRPTYWMERGVNLEPEALAWFEVETDLAVQPIGFVSSDNDLIGASPDGMVWSGGSPVPLELKVPKPSTHIQWLLDGVVPKEHIAQVHFQMVLCDAPHAYFSSYNPNVAPLIVKVDWSDYSDTMVKAIEQYTEEFAKALSEIEGTI